MNMNAPSWKWLLEAPLAPAWRRRLELCAGVVLSGAAVVALAAAIPPDPERLAALHPMPVIDTSAQTNVGMEINPAVVPPSREMLDAVKAGDVAAMARAYRVGMTLDGTLSPAARSGHKNAVLWLLQRGANVHDDEHSAMSAVLAADAHPEIVALLREWGASEPLLVLAAEANAPNAVTSILAAHPEQAKDSGALTASARSALGSAADKRLVVTKLLEAGADPNETYSGDSALGAAVRSCDRRYGGDDARNDCMTIVRMLLDRDARVTGDALGNALSLEDDVRSAPLEALLERPIAKGVTSGALARATSVDKDDLARIVKLGVDWAWHDGEEDQELPVFSAVQRGDRDYVRALLDAGAPVDVHFKDASCALAEAIDGSAGDAAHARIVELLVERGANVNRRFPDGRTPLFAAAESGNIRVVNFLIGRGASVNVRVLDDTPLDADEQHGNIPAARVLSAHGGQRARPTF